jgi:putative membrane protein insertion efficiency factor
MRPIALGLIKAYKVVVSPYMPGQCRFSPTCSEYAADAITAHGVIKGTAMTASRLVRCRPGAEGGYDPAVPDDDIAPNFQPVTSTPGQQTSGSK